MKTIMVILSLLMLSACAETAEFKQYKAEKAERHAQKMKERKAAEEKDLQAYREWYNGLSYEEKVAETRWQDEQRRLKEEREEQMLLNRAMIANQALQSMRMGGPVLQYAPPPRVFVPNRSMPAYNPVMQQNQNMNCISTVNGQQVSTNCR